MLGKARAETAIRNAPKRIRGTEKRFPESGKRQERGKGKQSNPWEWPWGTIFSAVNIRAMKTKN